MKLQHLGCRDKRMSHKNFGNQPSHLIFYLLEKLEKFSKLDANTASKTDAIGWTSLMNGFRGEGSPPSEPSVMLPFPAEVKVQKKILTPKTAAIALKLYRAGRLPREAAQFVIALDDVKNLVEAGK